MGPFRPCYLKKKHTWIRGRLNLKSANRIWFQFFSKNIAYSVKLCNLYAFCMVKVVYFSQQCCQDKENGEHIGENWDVLSCADVEGGGCREVWTPSPFKIQISLHYIIKLPKIWWKDPLLPRTNSNNRYTPGTAHVN